MKNFEENIRHILFYYFKKGKKATEAKEKLHQVYGRMSSKNASARTDSPDSVMVIFQSKTLIAPVGLPRLTTIN